MSDNAQPPVQQTALRKLGTVTFWHEMEGFDNRYTATIEFEDRTVVRRSPFMKPNTVAQDEAGAWQVTEDILLRYERQNALHALLFAVLDELVEKA